MHVSCAPARVYVRGTHSETITSGPVEGRIIAVCKNGLGEDAAKRLLNFDGFALQRPLNGPGDLDYVAPRVSVGQHRRWGLDPGGKLRSGAYDRRIALGTGRNHSDFDTQKIRNKFQVIHGRARELRGILNSVGVRLPARERAIFGSDFGQILGRRGHFRTGVPL